MKIIGEIKALYDLTIPEFYGYKDGHGVADDRDKLLAIRRAGFVGCLFQVVFIRAVARLRLPRRKMVSAQNGSDAISPANNTVATASDAQYQYLRTFLKTTPLGLRVFRRSSNSTCHPPTHWLRCCADLRRFFVPLMQSGGFAQEALGRCGRRLRNLELLV